MVSVVIPLYNKEDTILRCLESVANQVISPFEVIIIDDGSTDGGLKLVQDWDSKRRDFKVVLVSRDNRGVAFTRNQGVAVADSKYVAFLDADDEWNEDFLGNIISIIDQGHDFSLISCIHGIKDSEIGYYVPNQLFADEDFCITNDYIKIATHYPIVNSSKVVINKKYFDKVGGFLTDAIVGEDLLLWIQLSEVAPIGFINRNLVTIHQQVDFSRSSRIGVVPYPIIHYTKEHLVTKKNKYLLRLLWSIHIKHLFGSLASDRGEALLRFRFGFRLFGVKNLGVLVAFLLPTVFWRKVRERRRRQLVAKNDI